MQLEKHLQARKGECMRAYFSFPWESSAISVKLEEGKKKA